MDNSFLAALAEGGFQVGELAKVYHPGGTEIFETDKDKAAAQTAELLKLDNVVIYEASFKFENLFVKSDVVVKKGNQVELIEVKAKSVDPKNEEFFTKKSLKAGKPELNSAWESYFVDVAFQTYVFKKCYPKLNVTSFLMAADKTATASVDGLNQLFLIQKDDRGRASVKVKPGTDLAKVGKPILAKIDAGMQVEAAMQMTFENGMGFEAMVKYLSDICKEQKFVEPEVGRKCKTCEFRIDATQKAEGKKSGFENCWSKTQKIPDAAFSQPFVFDVWRLHFKKTEGLIEDGRFFLSEITEEDISPTSKKDEPGLSASERQWIQVEKIKKNDSTPYFDAEGLGRVMKTWNYPLHFIDFETSMVAIPFSKGRRPYEQIAFQFSHHVVSADGKITHQTEYINREKGKFPNFDFVRALKATLDKDQGTIFRYSHHENTVLCQIRDQLMSSGENIPDRAELVKFIESVTRKKDEDSGWEGDRCMVDLCEMVQKYYFHPATKGSNSIKKVLPAILNESSFLQQKYSMPLYGTTELYSSNFIGWTWIHKGSDGKVVDPYKRLPPVFSDMDLETMDSLVGEDTLADGGAAMTAYARMQFTEMSELESEKVAAALLKYCELDTLAMVMIWEYWEYEILQNNALAALEVI